MNLSPPVRYAGNVRHQGNMTPELVSGYSSGSPLRIFDYKIIAGNNCSDLAGKFSCYDVKFAVNNRIGSLLTCERLKIVTLSDFVLV